MRTIRSILVFLVILITGLACQPADDIADWLFPKTATPSNIVTGRYVYITTATATNTETATPSPTLTATETTRPTETSTLTPLPTYTRTVSPTKKSANTVAPVEGGGNCNGADSSIETAVLSMINSQRSNAGISSVSSSSELTSIARNYSKSMAENNFFDHGDIWGRVNASGAYTAVGEIIYAGADSYNSASSAISSWLNSSDHREKILSPTYTLAGVGYWCNSNSTYQGYFTVDFARP